MTSLVGLTKKRIFSHISWFQVFIIVIIGGSSLLLSAYAPLPVNGSNISGAGSKNSENNYNNRPSITRNSKIVTTSNLNNTVNYLFTDTGYYNVSDMAIDSSGNEYITGSTSANNLITYNAYSETLSGQIDVFIAKISPNDRIIFSTYLGGSYNDYGNSIAVDKYGNSYITGRTDSPNFPTKNAFNNTPSGHFMNVFVAKFNTTGGLVFSTYLGGNDSDIAYSIAVDSAGNSYITGSTSSPNFPTKNAFNNTYGGGGDAFITELSTSGQLLFSTYLGGSYFDSGSKITVDSVGNVYVTGITVSSNFPTKNNFSSIFSGSGQEFVAKLNVSSGLLFSSLLDGTGPIGPNIAIDNANNVYVVGTTNSNSFPTKNAFKSTYSGNTDSFVTKLNSTGQVIFSTYLGGSGYDLVFGVAVDSAGNSIMTGLTSSKNFPIKNAFNGTFSGKNDAFITKFSATGHLVFSTYLGGSSFDSDQAIAVDNSGNCYVLGTTISKNFPTKDAYNSKFLGIQEGFVAKFNVSGQLDYSTYLGGNILNSSIVSVSATSSSTIGTTSFSTQSIQNFHLNTPNSILFLFGIVLSIIIIIGGVYTAVEYRKYIRIKKNINFKNKLSFREYFMSKFSRQSKKSTSKPTLSEDVFEMLEEIENENIPKE